MAAEKSEARRMFFLKNDLQEKKRPAGARAHGWICSVGGDFAHG
jgi:hypothetical protein